MSASLAAARAGVAELDPAVTLAAERQRTCTQVDALATDLRELVAAAELVATDDEHDPEGATLAFERSRLDALLSQGRNHLAELDRAEQRVAAGTYGVCVMCGAQIGTQRLAARPTASRCIACAQA